jgi:hypothetical protein
VSSSFSSCSFAFSDSDFALPRAAAKPSSPLPDQPPSSSAWAATGSSARRVLASRIMFNRVWVHVQSVHKKIRGIADAAMLAVAD